MLIPKITPKFDARFIKALAASRSGGKSVPTAQSGLSWVPMWDFLQLILVTYGKPASPLGEICKSKSDLNWMSFTRLVLSQVVVNCVSVDEQRNTYLEHTCKISFTPEIFLASFLK